MYLLYHFQLAKSYFRIKNHHFHIWPSRLQTSITQVLLTLFTWFQWPRLHDTYSYILSLVTNMWIVLQRWLLVVLKPNTVAVKQLWPYWLQMTITWVLHNNLTSFQWKNLLNTLKYILYLVINMLNIPQEWLLVVLKTQTVAVLSDKTDLTLPTSNNHNLSSTPYFDLIPVATSI